MQQAPDGMASNAMIMIRYVKYITECLHIDQKRISGQCSSGLGKKACFCELWYFVNTDLAGK